MAYLKEIPRYKAKLLESFTNNQELSKPDIQIFPFFFVPNEQAQKGIYLTFDLYVPQIRDKNLKDIHIVVNVFSHKEHIVNGENNQVDVLCSEIDGILNGSQDFGIDHVNLVSVLSYSPAENYYGKQLIYAVLDFNQKRQG